MSRVRHSSKPSLPWEIWLETETASPSLYKSGVYPPYVKRMVDVVTPNYNRRIADGEIINNPTRLTERVVELDSHYGLYEHNLSDFWFSYTGSGFTRWLLSIGYATDNDPLGPYDESPIIRKAKLQALSNVDNTPYAFGEDIGELGKTFSFLRKPLSSLYNLSKTFRAAVKKLTVSKGYTYAQAVAQVWLTWRFAVAPLVKSSYHLIEAATEMQKTPPERRSARGSATDYYESFWDNGSGNRYDLDFERNIDMQCRAVILYTVDNPIYNWQYTLGLRSKDIPETVWQLIPYSFMVDRLLDLTSAVSALVNLLDPAVHILAASATVKKTTIHSAIITDAEYHADYTETVSTTPYTVTDFRYQRDPYTPSLSDIVPPVTPGGLVKDATKIADLLALIVANFGR